MPVKLEPISTIEAKLGINPDGPTQRYFTNRCYAYMDKYVPKRDGNLRTIVDVHSNKIIYESPYAKYQYKGVREDGSHKINKHTTPGTGTYWDRRMVSAEIDKVCREVEKYMGGIKK